MRHGIATVLLAGLMLLPSGGVAGPVVQAAAAVDLRLDGSLIQGGAVTGTAPAGTVALHLDDQLVPVDADGRFLIA
ncbi:MAG TPA: M23 family peptidase, partial [Sphingobium sp.]|nr:M23 family peptidase [Sphingobium sp.]